jgi:hypothetical protein
VRAAADHQLRTYTPLSAQVISVNMNVTIDSAFGPIMAVVAVQTDMQNEILASLKCLPDATLVAQVRMLIGRERDVTAELVAHLAELDTRDVHLREGYTSLFVYCRDALGLSDGEAYNRIEPEPFGAFRPSSTCWRRARSASPRSGSSRRT